MQEQIFFFHSQSLSSACLSNMHKKTENWKQSGGNGNVIVKMQIQFPSHSFPFLCTPVFNYAQLFLITFSPRSADIVKCPWSSFFYLRHFNIDYFTLHYITHLYSRRAQHITRACPHTHTHMHSVGQWKNEWMGVSCRRCLVAYSAFDKKLGYRRRTARRAVSVEIMSTLNNYSNKLYNRGPIYKIFYDNLTIILR